MKDTKTNVSTTRYKNLYFNAEPPACRKATTVQRFINYVADNLLMQFIINWLIYAVLVDGLTVLSPDAATSLASKKSQLMEAVLIGIFNLLLYYTICEKMFRGYTIGKFLTGTRAVREDGDELMLTDALLRSFCRLVPLEAFSMLFGYGLWHDAWSKTKVIQVRR
ncbi:MAG TPA: RDD family protein [Flavisolibacter sp.]|jgi:uncharacterized RDD family membrane protein YckC|nr:RDD family protein [Flavisolibacter sp.]